jgi:hypothetical protein
MKYSGQRLFNLYGEFLVELFSLRIYFLSKFHVKGELACAFKSLEEGFGYSLGFVGLDVFFNVFLDGFYFSFVANVSREEWDITWRSWSRGCFAFGERRCFEGSLWV